MEFLFTVFPYIFICMFALIFGFVLFTIIRSVGHWNKNNNSPRLTVDATVVSKRMQVSGRHRSSNMHHSTYTNYYVTFQVYSGDRFELPMQGSEYGLLVEGDKGKLTFQGTRFLNFERS